MALMLVYGLLNKMQDWVHIAYRLITLYELMVKSIHLYFFLTTSFWRMTNEIHLIED